MNFRLKDQTTILSNFKDKFSHQNTNLKTDLLSLAKFHFTSRASFKLPVIPQLQWQQKAGSLAIVNCKQSMLSFWMLLGWTILGCRDVFTSMQDLVVVTKCITCHSGFYYYCSIGMTLHYTECPIYHCLLTYLHLTAEDVLLKWLVTCEMQSIQGKWFFLMWGKKWNKLAAAFYTEEEKSRF